MKTNTFSGLPEDKVVMRIILFLSRPTLMQLLSRSFRNQSQQDQYWKRLICEHFYRFATPNQLAEDKAPTLKNIYYILSLYIQAFTREEQGLVQTKLNTFLAPDPQQNIHRFPWACYIQGILLLRSENVSDNKRAYSLLKSAIENKFPGPLARRAMASAYRKTTLEPDDHYRFLLESAFDIDKDPLAASELGRFFEFELKKTSDTNLEKSFRQSAIKWHEEAHNLKKYEVEKDECLSAIIDLLAPGSEELFNFLNKHGRYNAIFVRYEDFTKNKVITSSKKELHDSWLKKMRETKDVTSKKLYAKELLKIYQAYLAGPTDSPPFGLNVSQIMALEKECCVITGAPTIEKRRAELNKNRVFQQQSEPPTPQTPSEDKCLIR